MTQPNPGEEGRAVERFYPAIAVEPQVDGGYIDVAIMRAAAGADYVFYTEYARLAADYESLRARAERAERNYANVRDTDLMVQAGIEQEQEIIDLRARLESAERERDEARDRNYSLQRWSRAYKDRAEQAQRERDALVKALRDAFDKIHAINDDPEICAVMDAALASTASTDRA